MHEFNISDEAIIDAAPNVVYDAFVDEMNGKTSWWAPHHTFRLLSGESFDSVGARLESTVQTKWPVKYTTETIEAVPGHHIHVKYTAGSFRGEADWTFEEVDGKTKIGCRWRTTPAGSLRPVARILPVAESHSKVTVAGFEMLQDFLG